MYFIYIRIKFSIIHIHERAHACVHTVFRGKTTNKKNYICSITRRRTNKTDKFPLVFAFSVLTRSCTLYQTATFSFDCFLLYFPNVFVVQRRDFVSGILIEYFFFKVGFEGFFTQIKHIIHTNVQFPVVCVVFGKKLLK